MRDPIDPAGIAQITAAEPSYPDTSSGLGRTTHLTSTIALEMVPHVQSIETKAR